MSQKNAQDLGDGAAIAVSLATFRSVFKSARVLGQTAKEAKLVEASAKAAEKTATAEKAATNAKHISKPETHKSTLPINQESHALRSNGANKQSSSQSRHAADGTSTQTPKINNQNKVLTSSAEKATLKNAVPKSEQKKAHILYVKRHPQGGKPYVGRTSGKAKELNQKELDKILKSRDHKHHKNKEGFKPAEKIKVSKNKDAVRGEEQRMIDKLGGAQKTGGTSSNKINGIAKNNPKREQYIKAAEEEFGDM